MDVEEILDELTDTFITDFDIPVMYHSSWTGITYKIIGIQTRMRDYIERGLIILGSTDPDAVAIHVSKLVASLEAVKNKSLIVYIDLAPKLLSTVNSILVTKDLVTLGDT